MGIGRAEARGDAFFDVRGADVVAGWEFLAADGAFVFFADFTALAVWWRMRMRRLCMGCGAQRSDTRVVSLVGRRCVVALAVAVSGSRG